MGQDRWNVALFSFKNLIQVNRGVEALRLSQDIWQTCRKIRRTPLSMCRQGKRSSSKRLLKGPTYHVQAIYNVSPHALADQSKAHAAPNNLPL